MRDRTLPNPIHLAVMLALALALAVSAVLAPIPVRAAVATGQADEFQGPGVPVSRH